MVLKGLPAEFKTFSTVIVQKEKPVTFSEFKLALRNFEETEKSRQDDRPTNRSSRPSDNSVMKSRVSDSRSGTKPTSKCFSCGGFGHKKYECPNKDTGNQLRPNPYKNYQRNRWCTNCNSATHDTAYCRRNKSSASKFVKTSTESDHSFAFSIRNECSEPSSVAQSLLVDCGATVHIVKDETKFIKFDESFDPSSHFIELADGSKTNNVVSGRGDASMLLYDINGNCHNVLLKNALYVPSYKQNIFSVQAATERGVSVTFNPGFAELRAPDGTIFNVEKSGKLYYLNNVNLNKEKSLSLQMWHRILGHCNKNDVLKLESVVEGMKIKKYK